MFKFTISLASLLAFSLIGSANAQVSKREFTQDGIIYIEETKKEPSGVESKFTYPKEGQEKTTFSSQKNADGSVTTSSKTTEPGFKSNITITQSKKEVEANTQALGGLNLAIVECKPFQASIPHPMMPAEVIKMQVHGISNGKCKFTQTMPGNGLQTCLFSDAQRLEIKASPEKSFQALMVNPNVCSISGY